MDTDKKFITTATMSAVVKQVDGVEAITMMDAMRSIASKAPGNCFA